jgi:hypothetical protein
VYTRGDVYVNQGEEFAMRLNELEAIPFHIFDFFYFKKRTVHTVQFSTDVPNESLISCTHTYTYIHILYTGTHTYVCVPGT